MDSCDDCGPDTRTTASASSADSIGGDAGGALAPIIDMDAHRQKKRREKETRDLHKLFLVAGALLVLAVVVWWFSSTKKAGA